MEKARGRVSPAFEACLAAVRDRTWSASEKFLFDRLWRLPISVTDAPLEASIAESIGMVPIECLHAVSFGCRRYRDEPALGSLVSTMNVPTTSAILGPKPARLPN